MQLRLASGHGSVTFRRRIQGCSNISRPLIEMVMRGSKALSTCRVKGAW